MHVLRSIVGIVSIVLLPIFLFAFGLLFSLYQVYGSPDRIKVALEQSGAYDTFVQDALNSLQRSDGDGETEALEGLPLGDPQVQAVIRDALPSDFLKAQTTQFLDSTYAWVRGDVAHLEFTIDLHGAKTRLADGLAGYADERLAALPVCTSPPDTLNFEALDVFNIDCVPPVFDRPGAVQRVHDEIAGDEFLEDPVITADDLTGKEGRTPEQQLQGLRNAYTGLLAAVYVTGIASLLLIAGAVLAPQWRTGLRRTAAVAIAVGGVSALLAWAGAFVIKNVSANLANDGGNELQATIADIIGRLATNVRTWWLGYGILLIVLGIAALVALRLTRPPQEHKTVPDDHTAGHLSHGDGEAKQDAAPRNPKGKRQQ